MKKYILIIIVFLTTANGYAQDIVIDIFGNLEYEEEGYKAFLEKDIFDNIIFTDTNDNKLTYEKKYLKKHYPNLLADEDAKISFFKYLMQEYALDKGYKVSFSIDIFDTEIVKDNCNNKQERGVDIFGNPVYKDRINGEDIFLRKNLLNTWEYKRGDKEATLKKDIFDKWCYSDSYENRLEFSPSTWKMLLYRHQSERNIFIFLINEFLPEQ